MFRINSIRTRLILLALAVVMPLLALVVFEMSRNFDANSDEAEHIAAANARAIGARIDEMIGNVDALLLGLSRSLPALPAAEQANDATLRSIKAELPRYFHNVRLSARDGSSLGHSGAAVRRPLVERAFFRDAIEQRRFAVGDAAMGYGGGGWMVGFGRPVLGKDGEVVAVASAAILLEAMQDLLQVEGLPPTTLITVLDGSGVVLARTLDPVKWVGKKLAVDAGALHALGTSNGAIEATDADGVVRLSGFATAKRVPWLISVGVPATEAYAPAHSVLVRAAWLALLCLALSALLAALLAARIVRPLRRLQQDVTKLAAGNLAHRSELASADEIGLLGAAFNDMAQALESQEEVREQLLQRFELVSRAANDVLWDWNIAEDSLWWSTGLQTLLGYRAGDVEPRIDQRYQRMHPEDRQRIRDSIERVIASAAQAWEGEYRFLKADGGYVDIYDRGHVLRDQRGKALRMIGAMQDVTARKRAVEELRASEERYRNLFDLTPLPMWVRSEETLRFLEVNDAALRTYGYTREEFLSMTTWDIRPPEDFERYRSVLQSRDSSQPVARGTGRHLKKDRGIMDVEVASHALSFYASPARLTIVNDITEQKRAEEALRASEYQLRLVTDNIPAMIAYHDAGQVCRYANRRYEQFYGKDDATVGSHQREVLGEEGYAQALPYLQRLLKGEALSYQRTYVAPDGGRREIEVTGIPARADDAAVCGFYVMIQDITERKRTEQALRDSEERLRTVANNVPALIGYIDSDQRYRYVNRTYEDWYAKPASDYFGRTLREVTGEEMYERLRPQFEAALRGETVTVERHTRGVEDDQYARFTYAPHFALTGEVLGFYVLGYDITERRRAENAIRELNAGLERRVLERTAQLVGANKELEAFSYSVSHDLRAPLRSIDGFSQALLEEYESKLDEQGRDFLHRIRRSSQRMAQLIDDLLGLARVTRTEMVRSRVDLSALAWETAGELQKSQPGRKVDFAIAPGLLVNADANLMRVMLDNLLANAWKFSSRVEHAKIEFGETTWKGRHAYFVRDNGAGFDMTYADKLFGAFQRLHNAKEFQGTGIGLATVQRIVRRHGGDVWGEGKPGQGATFYFSLESPEAPTDPLTP